jgi:hypothetical protein
VNVKKVSLPTARLVDRGMRQGSNYPDSANSVRAGSNSEPGVKRYIALGEEQYVPKVCGTKADNLNRGAH